jgi:DNA-binding beta-propeller fold protein YncE
MGGLMKRLRYAYVAAVAASLLIGFGLSSVAGEGRKTAAAEQQVAPRFVVDPFWPKPLPNNWLLGQVAGIAVDSQDHIWIVQRPASLTEDERGAAEGRSNCCFPAPPVMEFDAAGNFIQGWGGPGAGYDWPENEHGIFVDYKDNVWIAGNGEDDHQVLKFSADGTFLMQIGQSGRTAGSNSRRFLGQPADTFVDPARNEVYVADGYLNHRVIVFDADTGRYKRHWGAFGNRPSDDEDASPSEQFGNPVHCVHITNDQLVYVCDRVNNRVQIFRKNGTFVRQFEIEPDTLGNGSTWDVDVSPDRAQRFLYNADGENNHIWLLERATEDILGTFGRNGRNAGYFHWVHNLAVDSEGNIYTAEVDTGKRIQKFDFRGTHRVRRPGGGG